MGKLSRKETAAIAFIIVALVCGLGWAGARLRGASASGVTLQEAFPQPPAGPPPGRPMVPVPPTAGGVNAAPADISAAASGSSASHAAVAASSPPPRSIEGGASAAPSSTSREGIPVPTPTPEVTEIVVHVAGAVHKPGVYHLPIGARNDEAIQKAGGPTSEANMDALNLAARVEDGSQLYLPTRKQHPEGGADAPTETTPTQATAAASAHAVTKAGGKAGAHPAAKAGAAKGGKGGKFSSPGQGTVNINTATAEELERIPGIGPAMAARILEFRQTSGKFTAPEDLLQISGIGEKKFAKMQPFVRVK